MRPESQNQSFVKWMNTPSLSHDLFNKLTNTATLSFKRTSLDELCVNMLQLSEGKSGAWAMTNRRCGWIRARISCRCMLHQHQYDWLIVQSAYHKLYNRPASPLSCLCSSSCSSPLLNKNKPDVDSLQWGRWRMLAANTLLVIYRSQKARSDQMWPDGLVVPVTSTS